MSPGLMTLCSWLVETLRDESCSGDEQPSSTVSVGNAKSTPSGLMLLCSGLINTVVDEFCEGDMQSTGSDDGVASPIEANGTSSTGKCAPASATTTEEGSLSAIALLCSWLVSAGKEGTCKADTQSMLGGGNIASPTGTADDIAGGGKTSASTKPCVSAELAILGEKQSAANAGSAASLIGFDCTGDG